MWWLKVHRASEFPGGLEVKDSALSLLWFIFDPWPWELLHVAGVAEKKNHRTSDSCYYVDGKRNKVIDKLMTALSLFN